MFKKLKKQIGGTIISMCPPGFICMSNNKWLWVMIGFICIFLPLCVYLLFVLHYRSQQDWPRVAALEHRFLEVYNKIGRDVIPQTTRDDILEPPEREYRGRSVAGNELNNYRDSQRGVSINVKTRGQDSYQQVGVLYKINDSTDKTVLPLYGRRLHLGSNMWNYYTTTDSHSIVKLPLHNNGNNCTSDRGCNEFMNDETITITALGGSFKVEIYEYDAPRYIPYL